MPGFAADLWVTNAKISALQRHLRRDGTRRLLPFFVLPHSTTLGLILNTACLLSFGRITLRRCTRALETARCFSSRPRSSSSAVWKSSGSTRRSCSSSASRPSPTLGEFLTAPSLASISRALTLVCLHLIFSSLVVISSHSLVSLVVCLCWCWVLAPTELCFVVSNFIDGFVFQVSVYCLEHAEERDRNAGQEAWSESSQRVMLCNCTFSVFFSTLGLFFNFSSFFNVVLISFVRKICILFLIWLREKKKKKHSHSILTDTSIFSPFFFFFFIRKSPSRWTLKWTNRFVPGSERTKSTERG